MRWLPLYRLSQTALQPPSPASPASDIESLYPEIRHLAPGENPFPVPFAERRYSMLIEPAVYLQALIRDFPLGGGRILVREFRSAGEVLALR